jgi:hypothetical protein
VCEPLSSLPLIASRRCGDGRRDVLVVTTRGGTRIVATRVLTRAFAHESAFSKFVYGCALFSIHGAPAASFCASRVLAAVVLRPLAALWINRWQWLVWPSARHVFLRECVPFLRGQIRQLALTVTFPLARLHEPVRVSLLLA